MTFVLLYESIFDFYSCICKVLSLVIFFCISCQYKLRLLGHKLKWKTTIFFLFKISNKRVFSQVGMFL